MKLEREKQEEAELEKLESKKIRPVTVRMEQFREDLNRAVTNSELPAYLLEILMEQYLQGISRVSQQEYAQDRAEWERMGSEIKAERS